MDLYVNLGLLLGMSAVVAVADVSSYIPQIAKDMAGNVTNRTFALVQPDCIFNQYTTTNVWLVVARNTSFSTIADTDLGTPVPYSSFINGPSNYYHTLLLPAVQYPCSTNHSHSINVLQIGIETHCTGNPFCNGPLTNNYTYREKFILLDSTGIFAGTQWSDEIILPKDRNFLEVIVGPSNRSGGMIVMNSILCVLLAILLICLIAALVIGSQDICWRQKMDIEESLVHKVNLTHFTYSSRYQHM